MLFNLYQNTDEHCLVNLQYASTANPKLFSFIRNLTSNFGRHAEKMSEDGEARAEKLILTILANPGISGNAVAKSIIDCVAFFYEKGKGRLFTVPLYFP